jgi:LCP family protein required for cell wall assembly
VRNGVIILLVVCVGLAGSGYLYLRYELGRIKKVDIPGLASDDNTSVMNVLLVGSDSRENVSGDLVDATGKGQAGTSGQRSDTIMVLHIDPTQQKATILSIPRDLYVPIAGTSSKDKINAAFSLGGATKLVETIQQNLGIEINHYAEVDFSGFERIVNTIGGVKVYVDAPARDSNTGLDIPVAGCSQLDGFQALAFVRSRYYETYEHGQWLHGSNSDIDRITRQQDFIRRILSKAVSSGLSNPLTLNRLIGIGVANIQVDQAMSTKDITTLARKFRSLDANAVEMLTLPTTDSFAGSAQVELLDKEKAYEYIDRLNGKTAPQAAAVQPAGVSVRVLNGNGIEGVAAKAGTSLQQLGFRIVETTSADNYSYPQTIIRYAPGAQAQADLLHGYLTGGAKLERDATLTTTGIVLVLGADYTGVRAPVAAPSSGTSAPAAPVTTSPPKPSC